MRFPSTPPHMAVCLVVTGLLLFSTLTGTTRAAPGAVANPESSVFYYPAGRSGAAMVYDPLDRYVVLFGGSDGVNDTWTFSGGKWSELSPSVAPPPREYACSAWDSADGYLLLFGGLSTGPSAHLLNDTWEFVHGKWTELFPANSPPPEMSATCAYDVHDQFVVLFGGSTDSASATNQTWTFVGGEWTQQRLAVEPPARSGGSMFYFESENYLVLFGGQRNSSATPGACAPLPCQSLEDSWEFNASYWVQLYTKLAPPGHWLASAAYDAGDGYGLLFGGLLNGTGSSVGSTWVYSHGQWWNLTPPIAPPARFGSGLVFDGADGYVLLFGGTNSSLPGAPALNDTWNYSAGQWTNISNASRGTPPPPPPPSGGPIAGLTFLDYLVLGGAIVAVAVAVSVLVTRRGRRRGRVAYVDVNPPLPPPP